MRNRTMIVAALLALGIVATACTTSASSSGAASPSASSSESSSPSPTPPSPAPPANVAGKKTFTIDAEDFFFSPSVLTGSAGQQLTLTIDNQGAATHTFTIASEHIDVTLAPGTQQTVKVTFPNSGSTEFLCRFHESMGMTGELQVA
jgi:plastocyanin